MFSKWFREGVIITIIFTIINDTLCEETEKESNIVNNIKVENIDKISAQNYSRVSYEGAQLWRILRGVDNNKPVNELQNKYDTKFWLTREDSTDILIQKEELKNTALFLQNANITYEVLIENIQEAINTENPSKEEIENFQNRKGHRMTWKAYHKLSDIYGYLEYLAKTYPSLCSVHNIGFSSQGIPLKLLKISDNKKPKKAIWIDGGIHAREWISPSAVTYVIDQIVENWEDLPPSMHNIDWYILAVVNPDGYEYSHNVDRLWRKSRKGIGRCFGVDLNRNFGYKWGGKGVSHQPCSETYGGTGPASEPETIAVQNFLKNYGSQYFQGYITIHSYGQYILYPWGYDKVVSHDHKDLKKVAEHAALVIAEKTGARYSVGPSGALLYPAAGGSDDWAKGALNIKYAYTIELRDTGKYGFVLPSNQIELCGKETFIFVETVAEAIKNTP